MKPDRQQCLKWAEEAFGADFQFMPNEPIEALVQRAYSEGWNAAIEEAAAKVGQPKEAFSAGWWSEGKTTYVEEILKLKAK